MKEQITNLKNEWMSSKTPISDFLFKKTAELQGRIELLEKEQALKKDSGRDIEFCFFDASVKIDIDGISIDSSSANITVGDLVTVSIDGEFHNPMKLLGIANVFRDGTRFYARMRYPFDPSRCELFPSAGCSIIESVNDGKKTTVKSMMLNHVILNKKQVQQPAIKEQWSGTIHNHLASRLE